MVLTLPPALRALFMDCRRTKVDEALASVSTELTRSPAAALLSLLERGGAIHRPRPPAPSSICRRQSEGPGHHDSIALLPLSRSTDSALASGAARGWYHCRSPAADGKIRHVDVQLLDSLMNRRQGWNGMEWNGMGTEVEMEWKDGWNGMVDGSGSEGPVVGQTVAAGLARGRQANIEVVDGRIDIACLGEKAIERGLITAERARMMSQKEIDPTFFPAFDGAEDHHGLGPVWTS